MATAPTTPTTSFQPLFKRISQGDDRHADVLACLAMLCGKPLAEVIKQAQTMGMPKTGPYYAHVVDGDFIARFLGASALVATVWKEGQDWRELPDVAIVMGDYDAEWAVGRCVLFHRIVLADGKSVQTYLVDPYPHLDAKLHVRTDLTGFTPSWYIGVHAQNRPAGKVAA
jgi:hypothetical protein